MTTLVEQAKRSIGRYASTAVRTDWLQEKAASDGAAQESDIPNFKGSYLGHFPLASDGRTNGADAGQIGLLIAAIYYTKECEDAMEKIAGNGDEAPYVEFQTDASRSSDLILLTKGKLDGAMRTRVMCMITYDAHSRDMIEKTLRAKSYQISSFQWQSQLKMRFDESQNRAAGTGKTEHEGRASALGKCCYVFNCSPEMDYKSLGNIFKGLACSGSWGCFDEFNRLIPEVLSVCTVQFKAVCNGVKRKGGAQDLLSKQEHYDWGLRAIKSVLVQRACSSADPDSGEDNILMRALRDFNIAKIVKADEVVFFGLLNDLFPGLDPPRVIDKTLEQSVEKAVEESGQFGDDVFKLKCVQLDELIAIRHCVFVMGPPGSFKTSCWKMLANAYKIKDPDNPVKVVDINPKTMPTQDLYGYINMVTRDWKDGLLSTIMRDLGQIDDEKPKWILLDGDLDANWIESMNSVMDDNRLLTLASNERIPLKPHMRMIFEIRDLKYARRRVRDDVENLLRLLDATLTANELQSQRNVAITFSFCAVWALGSSLGIADDGKDCKRTFSEWWKKQFRNVQFPTKDTVFDYWLDTESMSFESWKSSPAFSEVAFNSREMNMSDVTVPTGESASVSFWLKLLVDGHHCAMLAGPSGTGKTQLINGQLKALNPEQTLFQTINMNFYSSGLVLQANLEVSLQKKTGSLYGPPGACHMVYFIDDLNLPELDKYNTQSAIALVRQHLDYTHWYDITARSRPSRTTSPWASSQAFLSGHINNVFTNTAAEMMNMLPKIIKTTLLVHKDVSENFRKTATNFHYEFNIRHVAGGIGEDPIYDQIHELAVLQKILDQALGAQRGHALLVGVGGSGKKSLSRLSSFICGFQTTMIQISAAYGINDLKVDLQAMYNRAGVKSEGVMFLFTDAEITNERFLVYLNDLLGSAVIADLYAQDEKDTVINSCMKKAKAAGFARRPGPSTSTFAGGAQEPARRALLLARRAFRMRCRKFPALVNCTVIDWFQPWPKQALYSVGCKFLAQIEDLGGEEVRQQIENFMPYSFDSTNKAAVEYFDMDGRYVYDAQATKRLKNGVQKLEDCTKVVDVLKEEIAGKVADAEEKKATADGIAKRVKAEKEVVEMESENASIEEKKVTKIAAEVTAKQQSAEADLAKAVPAVEAAMAALDTLDVKQLQMCKTMAKPPPGVDDVFSACLVLLAGLNPAVTVQKSGKKFVDELKSYKESFDGGKVPLINFKEVRFYLAMEHFQPDIIMGKNSAAAGLCNWCINIVVYYDVVSMVEPKKKLVAEATIQLQEANHKLEQVRKKVAELEERLAILVSELQEAEKVKNEAEEVVAKGQMKLGLAERLLGALSSENVRWCAGIESLGTSRALLVGDTLLSAAFISYIGPFTKQYRTKLLEEQWALTTDSEIALWQTMKLPADPVSTENGAIVSRSTRWPLLIDPQLQGVAWVKTQNTRDKNAMLRVSRLGTKDLLKTLKECLVGGFPMLVENMGEQIEASIMPAVQREDAPRPPPPN
ncbi:hypothetical protein JL720_11303 [Aureococcus anophagefferens]|nr:hypothetical protein JL720_11303 [Aureococcus anophagefferens]